MWNRPFQICASTCMRYLCQKKRLEELNYLAYRAKWMDSHDEAVFGTVIEMMKPETLQDMINLSCNMDKFRYLPGVTTEAKLGEHLLKGNADMAMEEQAARSNYEGIGKDYIIKHWWYVSCIWLYQRESGRTGAHL